MLALRHLKIAKKFGCSSKLYQWTDTRSYPLFQRDVRDIRREQKGYVYVLVPEGRIDYANIVDRDVARIADSKWDRSSKDARRAASNTFDVTVQSEVVPPSCLYQRHRVRAQEMSLRRTLAIGVNRTASMEGYRVSGEEPVSRCILLPKSPSSARGRRRFAKETS